MFTILQPSIVIHQAQLPHDDGAQGQVNQRPRRTGTLDSTDHYLECISIYIDKIVQNLKRGWKEGRSSVQISMLGLFTFLLLWYSIEYSTLECISTTLPPRKREEYKVEGEASGVDVEEELLEWIILIMLLLDLELVGSAILLASSCLGSCLKNVAQLQKDAKLNQPVSGIHNICEVR